MGFFDKVPNEKEAAAFKDSAIIFQNMSLERKMSVYEAKLLVRTKLAAKGYSPSECKYAVDELF